MHRKLHFRLAFILCLALGLALFSSCSTSSRLGSSTSGNNYEPALLVQSQLAVDTPTPHIAIHSLDSITIQGTLEHNSTFATQTARAKPKATSTSIPPRLRVAEAPTSSTILENSVNNQLYSALSPWQFLNEDGEGETKAKVVLWNIFLILGALLIVMTLSGAVVISLALRDVWDTLAVILLISALLVILFLLIAIFRLIRKL